MIRTVSHVSTATLFVSTLGLFLACGTDHPRPDGLAATQQEVIYGTDDRQEVGELTNPQQIAWADATVSFFTDSEVSCSGGSCDLATRIYGDTQGGTFLPLCSGERFVGQPQGAGCSGFLIAPDLVATAGHCFPSQLDCDRAAIVFGFAGDASGTASTSVPEADVYGCSEIVAQALERDSLDALGDEDFALLRLDRPVTDRAPLPIRQAGIVPDTASLATLGSLLGLPIKYSPGASLRSNSPENAKFEANLDAAPGNSGGPVLDVTSGLVEGIISNGPGIGFINETQPDGTICQRTTHCDDLTGCENQAAWVKATRIESVVAVLEGRSCHDGILNGDETDVDCGGPDCASCGIGETCSQATDCVDFIIGCRQSVCDENQQCAVDFSNCECETDADCDDGIACTVDDCSPSFSCNHFDTACECAADADCDDGITCTVDTCSPDLTCSFDDAGCAEPCTEQTAIDLGSHANAVTVPNDACLRVRDGYPFWWGQRTMQLQSMAQGSYPVPYSWSNACAASSGSGTFTGDWQSAPLSTTNSACATLIDLNGDGSGNITLAYY